MKYFGYGIDGVQIIVIHKKRGGVFQKKTLEIFLKPLFILYETKYVEVLH
ncbi:MAG: hypothetical protein ACJAUR_000895 [Ulvibacter sp.]|jgi:hypothetical protein